MDERKGSVIPKPDSCSLTKSVRTRHDSSGSICGDNPEEYLTMMFDVCRTEDGKASVGLFLEELEKTGIRSTDPRLENMMRMLKALKPNGMAAVEDLKLEIGTFKTVLSENVVLVTKALQNQMIIPAFECFCDNITKIFEQCKENTAGSPADYIPQLAELDHTYWGCSICTVDGQRFSIGDCNVPFTIQSTCTPLTYAICLNELGEKVTHRYQGRKPSGRMFNEIVLDYNNKPHNPLVNSGAIMSAVLLLNLVRPDLSDMSTKFEFVHNCILEMAGGERLSFNNSVFLSERAAADRNFAIAYFMSENKCFPEGVDIKKALDFHYQLCSLETTCESQSVIAATLANGGVCPTTGRRVLAPEAVQHVRSLMYSCGMYNYSGQFAFSVGLPAKSGGSGVLMLVVPNVMGVALWSPPLDLLGNSVRGVQFCKELVNLYSFHRFDNIGAYANPKMDPTFKKYESASQIVIQMLLASASGDIRALQRWWLQDIDLNVSDYDGRTCLHLCAAEGHLKCVKFLVEDCKVNHNPKDRWERTPLTEAVHFNHVSVATYLKEYIEAHPVWREEGETCDEDDDDGEEEEGDGEKEAEIPFAEVQSEGGGANNETPTIVVNHDSGVYRRGSRDPSPAFRPGLTSMTPPPPPSAMSSSSSHLAGSPSSAAATSAWEVLASGTGLHSCDLGRRRSSIGHANVSGAATPNRMHSRSPKFSPKGSPPPHRPGFKGRNFLDV